MAGNSKNALLPFHFIVDQSMAGNVTSGATNIQYTDNCAIQLNFTGTPVGIFSVEGSVDHAVNAMTGVQTVAGLWIPVTLDPIPVASGSSGQILIDMKELSFPWIRVVYTRTSGTGTLNGFISAKAV